VSERLHKWYFSSDLWPSSVEARIPCGQGIRFRAVWKSEEDEDIHAMVKIPVPSLIYMMDQINDLTEERDNMH
jgi:hypothetical protein